MLEEGDNQVESIYIYIKEFYKHSLSAKRVFIIFICIFILFLNGLWPSLHFLLVKFEPK